MTYIVTGYYGSGKTEFAVSLARELAIAGGRVTIADLDVVNPFFRSREREAELSPFGIEVMGSVFDNHMAQDIPALSFAFLSRIRAGEDVIIDLAGGEIGLRVLASCYDAILQSGKYQFLCVLNMYRPETDSFEKMLDYCHIVNATSRLSITALVNNGNLMAETEPEHVLQSQEMVLAVARELGVPLGYTLVREGVCKIIKE